MNFLGNLAWLILGGLLTAFIYFVAGILFCITIVGIPFGVQLFKIGAFALLPFGREMDFKPGEPSFLSVLGNVLWIMFGWWEVAIVHCVCGLVFCITIVGIPFGLKHFSIAKASLLPFGQANMRKL